MERRLQKERKRRQDLYNCNSKGGTDLIAIDFPQHFLDISDKEMERNEILRPVPFPYTFDPWTERYWRQRQGSQVEERRASQKLLSTLEQEAEANGVASAFEQWARNEESEQRQREWDNEMLAKIRGDEERGDIMDVSDDRTHVGYENVDYDILKDALKQIDRIEEGTLHKMTMVEQTVWGEKTPIQDQVNVLEKARRSWQVWWWLLEKKVESAAEEEEEEGGKWGIFCI